MVLFDISSAFLVGGAIGLRGGGKTRDLALLAVSLGIAVPGLVFLEAYPDWDWQYLLDPTGLPPGIPAIFVGLLIGSALLGHWMSQRSVLVIKAVAGIFAVYCLWSLPRLIYVGTTAEYHAGEAALLPGSFLLLLAMVGTPAAIALLMCWRQAGRVNSDVQTG